MIDDGFRINFEKKLIFLKTISGGGTVRCVWTVRIDYNKFRYCLLLFKYIIFLFTLDRYKLLKEIQNV